MDVTQWAEAIHMAMGAGNQQYHRGYQKVSGELN